MTGWRESAAAWVESLGEEGDRGRRYVLDAPMLAHARAAGAAEALDVGCGEGRFCRMLKAEGIAAVGIDPTPELLAVARERDPGGSYLSSWAETLPFGDGRFGLVVSYLTLIDIADHRAAIADMARVLARGGTLLAANLSPWATARPRDWPEDRGNWVEDGEALRHFAIDDMLDARSYWTAWRGIRIINHHRPLSDYMAAFLGAGLRLTAFEEPSSTHPDPPQRTRYNRAPWFQIMVWQKV